MASAVWADPLTSSRRRRLRTHAKCGTLRGAAKALIALSKWICRSVPMHTTCTPHFQPRLSRGRCCACFSGLRRVVFAHVLSCVSVRRCLLFSCFSDYLATCRFISGYFGRQDRFLKEFLCNSVFAHLIDGRELRSVRSPFYLWRVPFCTSSTIAASRAVRFGELFQAGIGDGASHIQNETLARLLFRFCCFCFCL